MKIPDMLLRFQTGHFALIFLVAFPAILAAQNEPFYVYGELWDLDEKMILPHGSVVAVDMEDTTFVFKGLIDDKG